MDSRLHAAHVRGGSLWPESFSDSECAFLAKSLGKKAAWDAKDGPSQSVEFAQEWAAEASKQQVADAKTAMKYASTGRAGEGGVAPRPARKKTKKTTKED